ncbi:hypothetical protein ACSBR1_023751 [Camellia fascicularis]
MGFRILHMHKDYCEWIVKYRVHLRPILSVFPKTERKTIITCSKFNVLCVVKGANEKDFTLVLAIRGKVISYNVKSKTLKELHDLSTNDLDDWGASLIIGCTSSEHSLAAELIANNSDLLTEILIRVPAKSLIRFKSVSKEWLYLISDFQFASDHARRNHHSSVSALYFYSNRWSPEEQLESVSIAGHRTRLPTLSFLDGVVVSSCTITIERSCNGLILCSNGFRKPPYIVCNLTTKKFSLLPDIGPTSSESPHYKVLLFSYSYVNNGRWVEIEIYNSQTSSWKHISVPEPRGARFMFRVFWNGAIHGISYANVHARFEVEEEKLIQTPMPRNPKILSHDKIWYFGECGGDLLLIQTPQRCAMGFRILQMHRDYCEWIVKYRVHLRPILSVLPKTARKTIITCCEFNVLCVVKGANEKDFTLVLAIRGKVISYNVKSKTLKELHDLSTDDLDDWGGASWCNTYQFIESLSPV